MEYHHGYWAQITEVPIPREFLTETNSIIFSRDTSKMDSEGTHPSRNLFGTPEPDNNIVTQLISLQINYWEYYVTQKLYLQHDSSFKLVLRVVTDFVEALFTPPPPMPNEQNNFVLEPQ